MSYDYRDDYKRHDQFECEKCGTQHSRWMLDFEPSLFGEQAMCLVCNEVREFVLVGTHVTAKSEREN